MSEKIVKSDFTLIDDDEIIIDKTENEENIDVLPPMKLNLEDDKTNIARRMYITTNKSIATIANELGLSKFALQKKAQKEKWTLLKQNPDMIAWSDEAIEEIYNSVNFYDDAKSILHDMLFQGEFQNPSDLKKIVEAFKMSDEKTTQYRSIIKIQENREE